MRTRLPGWWFYRIDLVLFLRRVHILDNCCIVALNIRDDVILDRPSEKVELSYRRLDVVLFFVVEGNLVLPTERVKQVLRKCAELGPIMNVDVDMFLLRFHDADVVFFAIVGDEPIYQAQGYIGGAIHDIEHHFQVGLLREKLGERCEK